MDELLAGRTAGKRGKPPEQAQGTPLLYRLGAETSDFCDLGLDYFQIALRGDGEAAGRAILLSRAEKSAGGAANDSRLHSQLGFLEQVSGHS